ncbi:single-stranded DNA-binding protein [Gulosibacter molinativorax]|uniref:Single-stranded DNA-binding protein n=1 Tax=Gulosibacter molinativorax TaxID=256821 RepID=A0ABT7C9N9_9MICO|nr:single-stranded DNA-binding protein [Gulosibacter molinativorax]MDJ1371805.1 single-stranded DNA-binding protein [Gulosibacter molinativorax]QUY60823.1 Single-stranded DNA-binding protein [Gulosibacter molinativorax]
MTDFITVTGTVGTTPEHKVVGEQALSRTTFRLASSERRRAADEQRWEDAHTNWYSITAFGRLAANLTASLEKGQRVMVSGKLRIRTYTREDGSQGTQVEIIASAIGHDLSFQIATAAKRPGGERSGDAAAEGPLPDGPTPEDASPVYPAPPPNYSPAQAAPSTADWSSGLGATATVSPAEVDGEGDDDGESESDSSMLVDAQTGEVVETPF